MARKVQRALLSVSDKTGLEDFARGLVEQGVELLSTGGTYGRLREAGIAVQEVAGYTGFPEMMDGRIKTLHPKVHGGILALRDESTHQAAMQEHGIAPIDLVVVNLYPFESTIAKPGVRRADAIEQIDIGGPTMVRSAAKNHAYVGVVVDPADYEGILKAMQGQDGDLGDDLRRRLARKAFSRTAHYDSMISSWLFGEDLSEGLEESPYPEVSTFAGLKQQELRYGENPHQTAAVYRSPGCVEANVVGATLLGGKALSYNNLVDLDAALALAKEFEEPFVAVTKHNNPCGAAAAATIEEALEKAWEGDPLSAFGSVLALSKPVNVACADFLTAGGRFVEAIVAPAFEPEALEILQTRPKWGANVRLLACGAFTPKGRESSDMEIKKLVGGFLIQERDLLAEGGVECNVVTKAQPSDEQLAGLIFAQKIAKHVKSNAIVLARGTQVVGVGAGQMSRVDSVQLAVSKAGERSDGAVMGSDAFFPFPDGVEAAMAAGVTAVLQPGGSRRDPETIAACDARQVPMIFTGVRHFRH